MGGFDPRHLLHPAGAVGRERPSYGRSCGFDSHLRLHARLVSRRHADALGRGVDRVQLPDQAPLRAPRRHPAPPCKRAGSLRCDAGLHALEIPTVGVWVSTPEWAGSIPVGCSISCPGGLAGETPARHAGGGRFDSGTGYHVGDTPGHDTTFPMLCPNDRFADVLMVRHVPRGRLAMAWPVRRVRFPSSPPPPTGSHVPRRRRCLASSVRSVRFRRAPPSTLESPNGEGPPSHGGSPGFESQLEHHSAAECKAVRAAGFSPLA